MMNKSKLKRAITYRIRRIDFCGTPDLRCRSKLLYKLKHLFFEYHKITILHFTFRIWFIKFYLFRDELLNCSSINFKAEQPKELEQKTESNFKNAKPLAFVYCQSFDGIPVIEINNPLGKVMIL